MFFISTPYSVDSGFRLRFIFLLLTNCHSTSVELVDISCLDQKENYTTWTGSWFDWGSISYLGWSSVNWSSDWLAITSGCMEKCYSFPWIAPLYPWSVPSNAECKGGIKCYFWVFGMTRTEIELWPSRPLAKTLICQWNRY